VILFYKPSPLVLLRDSKYLLSLRREQSSRSRRRCATHRRPLSRTHRTTHRRKGCTVPPTPLISL